MKYLPLYKKWLSTGRIEEVVITGNGGLCNTVVGKSVDIFKPDILDEFIGGPYWGSELSTNGFSDDPDLKDKIMYSFTPLRQNMVLFLAAMNDEL